MPTNSDDRATTSGDKEPRQATTSRDSSRDRATTGGVSVAALSQPQPLTVEEAAQLLGVSPRTVQRRCQSGKLSAKQTQGEFGDVWEIDRATVENMASKRRRQTAIESGDKPRQSDDRAATGDDTERRQAATSAVSVSANDAAPDEGERAKSADLDDAAPDFRARYIAHIEEENRFLRLQLEAAMQSEAQTKAALREALKAMPRQMEAGSAATMPSAAPETASGAPLDTQAPQLSNRALDAVKSPQKAKGAAPKMPRPLWKVVLGLK